MSNPIKQVLNSKCLKLLCIIALFITYTAAFTTIAAASNPRDDNIAPPDITVRFAPSPGTLENDVHTGHFGFRIDSLPEPEPPPGYIFIGWFSNGTQIIPPVAATRNITILAAYAPIPDLDYAARFAIVFDPGPGQLPAGTPPILSADYNSPLISLPIPTNEGYSFNGWSFNDEIVTAPHIVRGDMIMEAEWVLAPENPPIMIPSYPIAIPASHFVVAFNPFPGNFSNDEIGLRFERGSATIRNLPAPPTRNGAVFVGWQLPNGNMLKDFPVLRGDTMLTAVWDTSGEAIISVNPTPVEVRPNPQTSPIAISLGIFGAVIGLGIGLCGALKMKKRQTSAAGKYQIDIARYVREVRMEIKNKRAKPFK